MARPTSLLSIPLDIYTALEAYNPAILTLDDTGPTDLYYLNLQVDSGGWVWENVIADSASVVPGFCRPYVMPRAVLRRIVITLRSNEWIVSRAIEELAAITLASYGTTNPQPVRLRDYNTPEWDDLSVGYTDRTGYIDPADMRGITGNYQNHRPLGSNLVSGDDGGRVQFTFTELQNRY